MVIAAVIVIVLMNFVFSIYKINGYSMHPTLKDKNKVMLYKLIAKNKLQRYDIVVFSDPEDIHEFVVKRIIGLPGEEIEIKNSRVFINGRIILEPYLNKSNGYFTDIDDFRKIKVRRHNYFLMGDNRKISNDSRNFGEVDQDTIYGKVILCYWPLSEMNTF
jgi:signal peptidase I